jgi:hypothetical protein
MTDAERKWSILDLQRQWDVVTECGVIFKSIRCSPADFARYRDEILKPHQRFEIAAFPEPNIMFNGTPIWIGHDEDGAIDFMDAEGRLIVRRKLT